MIAMVLLFIAGVWDLEKKEIPSILLYGIAAAALFIFWGSSFEVQLYSLMMFGLLGTVGWILVNGGRMGGGDVWILICFIPIWPVTVFWSSMCKAVLILGIVSGGIWAVTGDEKVQIPMIPFLILGYWI